MKILFKKAVKYIDANRKGIFWLMASLVFSASFLYVYFINAAAMHGVRLGKLEKDMNEMTSRVSDLEMSYLGIKRNVTLVFAYEKGFKDATGVKFISVKTLGSAAESNEI